MVWGVGSETDSDGYNGPLRGQLQGLTAQLVLDVNPEREVSRIRLSRQLEHGLSLKNCGRLGFSALRGGIEPVWNEAALK
jgi:hypothetical protein